MNQSIRTRQKALELRCDACVEAAIPYERNNPAKWREVSMLVLDMFMATSVVVERKLRDLIARGCHSTPASLTLSPEELDEYEAQVRKLERAVGLASSPSKPEGGPHAISRNE